MLRQHAHTYTHTHTHIHARTHIHTCTHARTRIHTLTVHIHVHTHAHTCTHMRICTHTHTHTRTHTYTRTCTKAVHRFLTVFAPPGNETISACREVFEGSNELRFLFCRDRYHGGKRGTSVIAACGEPNCWVVCRFVQVVSFMVEISTAALS